MTWNQKADLLSKRALGVEEGFIFFEEIRNSQIINSGHLSIDRASTFSRQICHRNFDYAMTFWCSHASHLGIVTGIWITDNYMFPLFAQL